MTDTLYDTDFYTWAQTQAAALRSKDWAALDLEHLAEEIESVGRSERFAIESHRPSPSHPCRGGIQS